MPRDVSRTTVGIVGGGPAGLMLSHLLHLAGIESVVIETRTRREIGETHRAGILERDSVRLLVDAGVSDRVLRDGQEHPGIQLRFGGAGHRIDFQELAGASTWLYPQTDVFLDLADVRVLAEVIERAVLKNDRSALDDYTPRALNRVWKAQHFSCWMTTLLHQSPAARPSTPAANSANSPTS